MMKAFLHDLLGLTTFLGVVSIVYVVVSLLVTGKIVSPAQLGMALR